MPAVPSAKLVDSVLAAFSDSGCQAQLASSARRNPRQFLVIQPEGTSLVVRVYIWTITHGGASRNIDEYRIQLTGVSSPLDIQASGPTVLLGWFPRLNVFGGFDISRHKTFTGKSPSVQITLSALNSALNFGWGFSHKDNNETAVAFRPDQLLHYCLNADALHRYGTGTRMVALLDKAAKDLAINKHEANKLPPSRKKLIQSVERWARDANFADIVINAYGRRCAVTRVQLNLLDAAHIYPVSAQGSTDGVTNGIALSPTYHRAFDQGLIFLDTDLKMKLNRRRLDWLASLKLIDGLSDFSHYLNNQIHIPADPRQRPSLDMIRKANAFRRIKC
jgi:putative restriction endonuclease